MASVVGISASMVGIKLTEVKDVDGIDDALTVGGMLAVTGESVLLATVGTTVGIWIEIVIAGVVAEVGVRDINVGLFDEL